MVDCEQVFLPSKRGSNPLYPFMKKKVVKSKVSPGTGTKTGCNEVNIDVLSYSVTTDIEQIYMHRDNGSQGKCICCGEASMGNLRCPICLDGVMKLRTAIAGITPGDSVEPAVLELCHSGKDTHLEVGGFCLWWEEEEAFHVKVVSGHNPHEAHDQFSMPGGWIRYGKGMGGCMCCGEDVPSNMVYYCKLCNETITKIRDIASDEHLSVLNPIDPLIISGLVGMICHPDSMHLEIIGNKACYFKMGVDEPLTVKGKGVCPECQDTGMVTLFNWVEKCKICNLGKP